MWDYRWIYLMLLPCMAFFIIFKYVPMYGIQLAFKDYVIKGIAASPWNNFEHFKYMMTEPEFLPALRNTLIISFYRILFGFPFPILLAIMINEVYMPRYKRVLQTIYTFPHFLTWVVMAGILKNMFASNGVINQLLTVWGMESVSPLLSLTGFRPFIWFSNIWKEAGWDTIIYMAALAGIDPGLYEAAEIDGANRWRKIWHITLPGIRSTILIMLILEIGRIMTTGASFDQVFNLYSSPVYEVADTIDTYIYRTSFGGTKNFGYTTAVGLSKSVIGVLMMLGANRLVTACGEDGLF